MADNKLNLGKYLVLGIAVVVMIGISIYCWSTMRRSNVPLKVNSVSVSETVPKTVPMKTGSVQMARVQEDV